MFPMIVRFKLDNCGIKLKPTKWRKMTVAERVNLANQACDSEEEILAYRNSIKNFVFYYTKREASDLAIQRNPRRQWIMKCHRCWLRSSRKATYRSQSLSGNGLRYFSALP